MTADLRVTRGNPRRQMNSIEGEISSLSNGYPGRYIDSIDGSLNKRR